MLVVIIPELAAVVKSYGRRNNEFKFTADGKYSTSILLISWWRDLVDCNNSRQGPFTRD
jgi:hypothetical protein